MSRASVTVTPSNRSCPRSRSRRTAADRLVGRSSSWPGSAKWPVMTIRAPAASAARNGTSSRSASSAFVRGTSGSSWCGSAAVSPAPGKCLAVAATPVALQAADGRRRELPDGLGIVAEAADPERRIGRIVGHVADRRVVHVDAEGPQLARHRAARRARPALRRRPRRAPSRPRTASSRRPGRPAGRPPGRRRPATVAPRPAVPPGSRRSAGGSGADRRRCGRGTASRRRRPVR